MATPAPILPSQPEVGLKERFFRYFQHEVTALQEQMERLNTTGTAGGERNDAIDHCLAGIDRLSHEVKDASSYIPAYDQRTYGDAIKALSEKLQTVRNSFAPPKKFAFKTARKNNSAISLSDAAELAQKNRLKVPGYQSDSSNVNSSFVTTPLDKLSPTQEKAEQEAWANEDAKNAKENGNAGPGTIQELTIAQEHESRGVNVSNHNRVHITPASASSNTPSGTVSHIRHSVIDQSPPNTTGVPFASLTLRNIKSSLIVCGQVSGPAHITAVENSVIVVACRQFRMHASKNVDVYLHSASRPIIEDCEGIRFAELPDTYMTPELRSLQNHWNEIDDFKWLQSEPSPHFSLLPATDRVADEVWKSVVPGGHSVSLDDILRVVKVLK